MRVLVTGATEFVGSRLVPGLLSAGHEVVVLTRDADGYDGPAEEVKEGDILDPGSFESALGSTPDPDRPAARVRAD
jgi:uncharacterized protein YbjT (DUF2867 family)